MPRPTARTSRRLDCWEAWIVWRIPPSSVARDGAAECWRRARLLPLRRACRDDAPQHRGEPLRPAVDRHPRRRCRNGAAGRPAAVPARAQASPSEAAPLARACLRRRIRRRRRGRHGADGRNGCRIGRGGELCHARPLVARVDSDRNGGGRDRSCRRAPALDDPFVRAYGWSGDAAALPADIHDVRHRLPCRLPLARMPNAVAAELYLHRHMRLAGLRPPTGSTRGSWPAVPGQVWSSCRFIGVRLPRRVS